MQWSGMYEEFSQKFWYKLRALEFEVKGRRVGFVVSFQQMGELFPSLCSKQKKFRTPLWYRRPQVSGPSNTSPHDSGSFHKSSNAVSTWKDWRTISTRESSRYHMDISCVSWSWDNLYQGYEGCTKELAWVMKILFYAIQLL